MSFFSEGAHRIYYKVNPNYILFLYFILSLLFFTFLYSISYFIFTYILSIWKIVTRYMTVKRIES